MNDLNLEKIAEAVSKQIPKKVVVKTTYYDELIAYDTYETIETKKHLCPLCKTALFHVQKYCENCGQKLEWEG
jgi:precorrin-4 methylase